MPSHLQQTHDNSSTTGAHQEPPRMLQNDLDPINLIRNQTSRIGVKFDPHAICNTGSLKIVPNLEKYHC